LHEVRGVLVEHPHSGGNAFGEENSLSAETKSQSQHESASAAKTPKKKWVEPVTALLMALATVGTAWSSYQSAAFTRRSNRLMNEFNSLERRANLLNIQGMQAASIHAAMFMQLLAAQQAGNEKLADFYAQRFPPDVRKAYDAWLAQRPFENPNADPHPFVPNLYEVRGTREAAEANAQAASKVTEARSSVIFRASISPTPSCSRQSSFSPTPPADSNNGVSACWRLLSPLQFSPMPSCASRCFPFDFVKQATATICTGSPADDIREAFDARLSN